MERNRIAREVVTNTADAFAKAAALIAREVAKRSIPAIRATTAVGISAFNWLKTAAETAPVPPTTTIFAGPSEVISVATPRGSVLGFVSSSGPPNVAAAGAALKASGKFVPEATKTTGATFGR